MILTNLLCLLVGFAILARHFEDSRVPQALPRMLPHDWREGFILLVLVFVLSGFPDNIAAALIVAYIVGFFGMLLVLGWNPHERERPQQIAPSGAEQPSSAVR